MRASVPISLAVAFACFASHAATVSVTLGGTIVPSSCTPTLSGGGVVDLGAIDAGTLSSSSTTNLAGVPGTFSVSCTGPTIMAFRILDNRLSSELGTETSYGFGLGLSTAGIPIGRYRLQVGTASISADSTPVTLIQSTTLTSWSAASADNLLRHANPNFSYAFANGPATPISLRQATFDFMLLPTINSLSALALTQSESLAGNATFEIVYL